MKAEDIYFIGLHWSYAHEPAKVIGIKMVTPGNDLRNRSTSDGKIEVSEIEYKPRLCYHVQFSDGKEDYFPIADQGSFKLCTFSDIIKSRMELI